MSVSGIAEKNAEEHEEAHDKWIIEIGNYLYGIEHSQTTGHKHLSSIGNQPLGETGKRIEDRGRATWVDAKALRYFLGQMADSKDGNGIIRRAEIGKDHQTGNAKFSPTWTANTTCETFENEINAPELTNNTDQACCHKGYNNQFSHVQYALAHGRKPFIKAIGST